MQSASDGVDDPGARDGENNLLESLRQRLEARRTELLAANSGKRQGRQQQQQHVQQRDGGRNENAPDGALHNVPPMMSIPASEHLEEQQLLQQQQHGVHTESSDHLLLLDLVSFDHCQEVPHAIEQQVLMQFDVGRWCQPLPSQQRQQADQLQRLPQEAVGLWVPRHPRINNSSLYKLEQRLAKGRTLDVQRIVKALQEQFPMAQQPGPAGQAALGPGGLWLDETGLMMYEPSPAKPHKERPWRRYDQDAASTATRWVPASAAPLHLLNSSGESYRLDVELGRLEFELHPFMALEQQLAAQLLCAFREYHRRASFGLSGFYGQRLAALEDALLNARELLFSTQGHDQQQEEEQQLKAVGEAEREVAEVRQLRDEEDMLLLSAVEAMAGLWQQLQAVRALQGGRQLTDLVFSVVQLPPAVGEEAPVQADGLTRQQLDVALLVAEAERIAGLPAYPQPLPVSESDAELKGFKLRRVECLVSSHALLRSELQDRLQLLEERVSADPDDPEILALRQQLQELGSVPMRQQLSHQQEMELWTWAEQEVAAGRAGVYRPPRLQPCLSVLPPSEDPATHSRHQYGSPGGSSPRAAPTAAVSVGSGSTTGAGDGTSPAATGRSRLGRSGQQQQQQQQQEVAAARQGQVLGLGSGQYLPVLGQATKLPVKLSYYARLLVNGRVVGSSEVLALREDFTISFRDVFSVRLLKWPDSMQLELWEKGALRDHLVAEFFLAVPGLGGSPHVDPQAKPYSWTSHKPVPHNRLVQAAASLQPLGVLPAARVLDASGMQDQQLMQLAATTGAAEQVRSTARAAAVLDAAETEPVSATDAGPGTSTLGHASSSAGERGASHPARARSAARSFAAMYPSGRLFVRCGWVADSGVDQHFTPFQHTDGAFAEGQAKQTALQHSLRLHNTSSFGEDATVRVNITGHRGTTGGRSSVSAPGSPSKQQDVGGWASAAYDNPLAHRSGSMPALTAPAAAACSPSGSPHKASRLGGAEASAMVADVMVTNPLALVGEDVEVGQTLAPPMPPVKADRALQRIAQGVGSKASAASRWLMQRRIDPNDPRNAVLLELLRAREATAHNGRAVGTAGVFRLDLPRGLSLAVDRVADRRVAFIKQRWTAGPFRNSSSVHSSHGSLQGARQLRVTAPLSAKDTLGLQDAHREALALIEAASMGVGGFTAGLGAAALTSVAAAGNTSMHASAASMVAWHDRAVKWSQGVLARALEARDAGIRSFALRLRATASKLSGGRVTGRFQTDDVVKDAPLPEFKLDLSTLAAAFAPVRPLRPQRRVVKKVQASVPRDTQLVITVQRASNLPRRIGGGGVRAQSPNRSTGARFGNDRFTGRSADWASLSGGLAGSQSGPTQAPQAGVRWPSSAGQASSSIGRRQQAADSIGRTGVDETSTSAGGAGWEGDEGEAGSTLSCFVEVHFRSKRQRTTAVDSNTPIWNEQLLFPVLSIDQEASPRGLRDSDNMITINVFDEVVTPAAAQKAMRAAARASGGGLEALTEGGALPERERRFLGCVRLSLAAVYQAEVVDGTFKLDVPPVLFGYVADDGRPASLAMYLTLKPRLTPPAPEHLDDCFTPGEQGDVTRHARKWVSGISGLSQCKARVIRAMAADPEGTATLLPRYLTPTPLPPALAAAAQQALGGGGTNAGLKTGSRSSDSSAAAATPAATPAAAPAATADITTASDEAQRVRGSNTASTSSSSSRSSILVQDSPASALDQLMLAAARWVAHVPFGALPWLGQQQSRAWANHADVLLMAAAGHEEHAHLLAGYFMALGQQAFVVLGSSLSAAQAAFVLTTGQSLMQPYPASRSTAAAGGAAADSTEAAAANADAAGGALQQQPLRERLAAAAAAAQAQQHGAAAGTPPAAALGVNPALEAAEAAEAAGLMLPPNVAQLRLWNPLTGHCVPVRDPACELRQVGTVYNGDNLWANIQESGHPWDISWHLGDASAWKPFFGPMLPLRELASVQVPPVYNDLDARFYEELEASAEEAVRDALYEARSVVVTQPNNKLSRVLKAMLRELPAQMRSINTAGLAASLAMSDTAAAVAGAAAADAAREHLQRRLQLIRALQLSHNDRVSREMRGCLINGHILSVPFGANYPDAVAQAVINSGVHRTVDPRVKFAMAAYVERQGAAYVACIWIYVAAIRETS